MPVEKSKKNLITLIQNNRYTHVKKSQPFLIKTESKTPSTGNNMYDSSENYPSIDNNKYDSSANYPSTGSNKNDSSETILA